MDEIEKIEKTELSIVEKILLYGTEDFKPSFMMVKLVIAWIEDEDGLSLTQLLEKVCGGHRSNWYIWLKDRPGFVDWFKSCLESGCKGQKLFNIKNALTKKAMQGDPVAIKIALELWEPTYKPTTAQEQRHSFAGYVPNKSSQELAEASRDRERKRIESKEI